MSRVEFIKEKLMDYGNVHKVLEEAGCEYVGDEQGGNLVTASLPEKFGNGNRRAVQVKVNESMNAYIRNRDDYMGGDIFNLISYLVFDIREEEEAQENFPKAIDFVTKALGLEDLSDESSIETAGVRDYTSCLKEFLYDAEDLDSLKNEKLKDNVMDYYLKGCWKDWLDEGISKATQIKFGVAIDLESKRVVFPIKDEDGDIVGIKGRIMRNSDDDRKYLYLGKRFNNRYELFGYHLAVESIKEKQAVIVVEGEKSVMKLHQWGMTNAVALGASEVTDVQARKIERLGEDVRVYICLDEGFLVKDSKDYEGLRNKRKNIERIVKPFQDAGRKIYWLDISHEDGVFDKKDAPVDKGKDAFVEALKNGLKRVR